MRFGMCNGFPRRHDGHSTHARARHTLASVTMLPGGTFFALYAFSNGRRRGVNLLQFTTFQVEPVLHVNTGRRQCHERRQLQAAVRGAGSRTY